MTIKYEQRKEHWKWPPFESGDYIESITDDHVTAARGRRFMVKKVYWTAQGWRVVVDHPSPRFKDSSYYCRKFKQVPGLYQPSNKENATMYIAIALKNTRVESLDINDLTVNAIAMDTTQDRGFKDTVEDYIRKNPNERVAIFELTNIVEAAAPVRLPVAWIKMK